MYGGEVSEGGGMVRGRRVAGRRKEGEEEREEGDEI